MNNSGLSTSISGSDNLPTNGGINAPNDTERNFPSVNNVDGSLRNVTTASNSDSMQVPAGTTAGATYESNVNAAPSGYNNGLGPAVAVQPRMQAADAPLGAGGVRMESSEPHGMSALPPSNPAAASTGATAATSMFDPSNGTGAPLLSIGSGTSSMPNPVLRAPSLGSFSMGLQGGHVPMANLTMQGPLLSNGSSTNAKTMQAHNLTSTESFVAMQPQGVMHTQAGQQLLPSASGAGMGGGNSAVLTSSPHTLGLSQPSSMPLNTFLSSHSMSSAPQASMMHQPQQHQQQQSAAGLQQQQPMMMQVDSTLQSMQPAQQGWMMRQQLQQQQLQQQQQQQSQQHSQQQQQSQSQHHQASMIPGSAPPAQMIAQHGGAQGSLGPQQPGGQGQGPGQLPVQQQPQQGQYHVQQGGMQGPQGGMQQGQGQGQQQMQYGQHQSAPHMQMQHQQPLPQQQHLQHQPQHHQAQQQMHMNVIPQQQQQQQMQGGAQQQQPQQQQGGSFAGTKFSAKAWHTQDHHGIRNSMVEEIIKLLKTRRPNATEDWHEKLPHMARRLEDALYHEAAGLDEYSDNGSLKQRLQQLALSMGGNKQQPGQNKPGAPAPQQQQGQQQQQMSNQMRQQQQYQLQQQHQQQMQQKPFPQSGQQMQMQGGGQQFAPQQPQYQQLARTAQAVASQYAQPGSTAPMQSQQPQQGYLSSGALEYQQQQQLNAQAQIQGQQQQQSGGGGMHGMQGQQAIHPNMQYGGNNTVIMGGNPAQSAVNPVSQFSFNPNDPNSGGGGGGGQMGSMQYAPMQGGMPRPVNIAGNGNGMSQQGQMMHQHGQMMQGGMQIPQHGGGQGHTEDHRRQVLKQQQQRLLLLRHASKCPHDNGSCKVTPHCWSMKQLWKHIMSCKDQECKIPHCVSSRYVLSHYSKCKEPSCPVCGPVREAIKRNVERSKDIVKNIQPRPNAGYGMPVHNAPQRDEPAAKRQKKKDSSKAAVDERVAPTLVIPSRPRPPPRSAYPLDPISCAIYCFSAENIAAHFKSIHEGMKLTVAKIREMCKPLIEELFRVPHAHGIFGAPVDPVMLGLSDYFDVVKMPMDLGTVMKKLSDGSYRDLHHFVIDVHLTFDNAMNYNPKNSDVYMLAKSLKKDFDARYKQKVADFEKNINIMRDNPDACLICGEPSLKFEPPVYYCNGTCAQRIRRNAVFFSNNTNTYHWCNPCFNNLKENETVRLPDCTVSKTELGRNKKKHTEESEEGWVQCEGGCQRWVHQVCSLFNARRNISDEVSYVCPLCIQRERTAHPEKLIVQPTTKKMGAIDLPVTILSQFLEKRIYKRLDGAYRECAQKLGVSENDVEKCPPLILRQVSCQDKMHTVREGVFNRYKEKNYPADFPCRSKCLVLFQNIDGQDVILFGMYVYEYGHKCPQPNQRRVYISYLDSVHYLRPKQYRTLVYHEILISYLDYVRARGFHTAHIWACPPQKGDDYILYVHPPDQKTPKPQILRVWYDEMLKRCVERGIVCEYTDFHTEYLVDPNNDATVLPYFEGDYWVNEAEVIIKNLKTGVKDDYDDDGGAGNKSKRKSKSKRLVRTEVKPMLLGKSERDPVMAKLASIIEPMKDTFFVARLHPKEYAVKWAETLSAEQTAASTGETSVQQEEKLREEALTGSDVQMPAGAEAPPAASAEESKEDGQQSGEEGKLEDGGAGSGGEDQMDDDDDDFGKAALSVSMSADGPGGEGEGGSKPALASSVSVMQFSDFTALKRAESFTSQGLRELDSGNQSDSERTVPIEEGGGEAEDSQPPATPSGRSARSSRLKAKSEPKTDAAEGEAAASAADTVEEESKVAEEESVPVKSEPYSAAMLGGSPVPSKGSGLAKPSSSSSADVEASAARDETKVKTEGEAGVGAGAEGESAMDVQADNPVECEGGDVATSAVAGRVKMAVTPPVLIMVGEDMPELKDDTEDVDDIQENEHFETRQSFLNLCQGNHYQFDQLRRAKHTSMMVLYHLHNPDAPKFVPSCTLCHADILTGYRHHCDTCEIDFCQNCVQNAMGRVHQHMLRPMAVSNSAPQQLTEEQRRERQRSVQLHMQLLQHAANCVSCESKNCLRMKEFLKHDSVCQVKTAGGCRLCARITNLLNIHARACRVEGCKVPHCLDLREQMRKLTLRQQQMDDRRRQNMNNEYGRGGASGGDTGEEG